MLSYYVVADGTRLPGLFQSKNKENLTLDRCNLGCVYILIAHTIEDELLL